MNLTTYNTTNSRLVQTRGARISFNRNGVISISSTATRDIGLKPGQKVSVVNDLDNPDDRFLTLDKEEGFVLRPPSADNNMLLFNCSALAHKIIDYTIADAKMVSMMLVTIPVINGKQKLYPIITSSAKQK